MDSRHAAQIDDTKEMEVQTSLLLKLPLVIVQLVLGLLDREDVYQFRLVSHDCHRLAKPYYFRKLILHDRNPSGAELIGERCSRLADPHDELSQSVCHLQIGPLDGKTNLPSDAILVSAMTNLKNLRDFSWHARHPIPPTLLSTFHTTHPTARLHLINPDRNPHQRLDSSLSESHRLTALYEPPDLPALSSPQLHSLDYSNYQATRYDQRLDYSETNEMDLITKALLQARNLKRLRFHAMRGAYPSQRSWSEGRAWFPFHTGDTLPPLEELVIPYEGYLLFATPAADLARALDATHLRRLELTRGTPTHLLRALAGKVPRLKALRCGFSGGKMPWWRADREAFVRFYESVEGLEEVVMENEGVEGFGGVMEGFFKRHGGSLKKVHVWYSAEGAGWGVRDVVRLWEVAPGIRELGFTVAAEEGLEWVGESRVVRLPAAEGALETEEVLTQPKTMVRVLRCFPSLSRLSLTICLDEDVGEGQASELLETGLSRDPAFTKLKGEVAKERSVALYEKLVARKKDPVLSSLEVSFRYGRPSRYERFLIDKRSVGASKSQEAKLRL